MAMPNEMPHPETHKLMSPKPKQERCRIGFLTVVETPDRGFVGGLLVTNQLGRPLEFQCTTPVKPNRTQEILYGPTLRTFICGELIADTLMERAGVRPDLVLVEQPEALSPMRENRIPRGQVIVDDALDGTEARVGGSQIRFSADVSAEAIAGLQADIPEQADLTEPFERIREALKETLKAAAA